MGVSLQTSPIQAPAQVLSLDPELLNRRSPKQQPQAQLVGPQGKDGDLPGSTVWDYETSLP